MSRLYVILDVFADASLSGNPLAVVLDAAGLDAEAMQAIAREFNLSETVFLLPAEDETRKAALRIFKPNGELPFAGHPTVGAAALLGLMGANAGTASESAFEVEENIGAVSCRFRATGRRSGHAAFDLPKLPVRNDDPPSAELAAAALGLDPSDIGFGRHEASRFSAGVPFCFVPVRSLDALGRARIDASLWDETFRDRGDASAYLYTAETGDEALAFRARKLEAGLGEDPATGSAVAALAGAVMAFGTPADGTTVLRIGQGVEMGRPSVIELGLTVSGGALAGATIGGAAVVTAEGTLFLS